MFKWIQKTGFWWNYLEIQQKLRTEHFVFFSEF
jgi:hypothetical protein